MSPLAHGDTGDTTRVNRSKTVQKERRVWRIRRWGQNW